MQQICHKINPLKMKMITYRIIFKKANFEEIKNLDKYFKKTVPLLYTGLAGKDLCFVFYSEKQKNDFIEEFNQTLEFKTRRNYELYNTKAIIYLR